MITGINTHFENNGKSYHIQIEDIGMPAEELDIKVYLLGTVVFHKRISYKEKIENTDKSNMNHIVEEELKKTLITIKAAIMRGKITDVPDI